MSEIGKYLGGFARHLITTAGGALVANGTLTGSDLELVAGAGAVLVGLAWSILQKKLAK